MNKKYPILVLAGLFMVACKSETASQSAVNCPETPAVDLTKLTGEPDPIASTQAVPCGTVNLWGSAFPKTLNYWTDPNSFSAEIMGLMFEPMVTLHSTENKPVGVLADRWEIDSTGKIYTFHLDSRARWSDGKPVLAEDVQFFYDVIMNPKHLTPVFKTDLERFKRPEVLDSLTLRVEASQSHWNNFWAIASIQAFPKHAWDTLDFNEIRFDFPVVSGPYQRGELAKNRHLELVRRTDWWGRAKAWNVGKYNFQKLRYKFMEDRNKALEALKKGDFDIYAVYTSSIWMKQTDFESVQKNWVIKQKISNREPIGFQGLSINLRRKKFQDIRVREALAMLLNRELMNDKYMFNQYFLQNSYYPDLFDNNISPHNRTFTYQPDSARQLLAQAGYKPDNKGLLKKNGEVLKIVFITQSADMRHLTKYVEDLRAVGIDASIEQMAWPSLAKRMEEFDYDMYWTAWGAGRLRDPETLWSSKAAKNNGSNNYPGVQDSVIDRLIEQQKTENDLSKRNAILMEIDQRLAQMVPYVLLWQADHHRLLYWNRFGTPKSVLDKFGREESAITYWWVDSKKDQALKDARNSGSSLPAAPAEVHWVD